MYVCVFKKETKKNVRSELHNEVTCNTRWPAYEQTYVVATVYYVNVASLHSRPRKRIVKVACMPRHCRLKKKIKNVEFKVRCKPHAQ